MNIRPLSNCLIIKQDVEKQGLIILRQNKLFSGVVVASGNGKRLENGQLLPMEVKINDRVIFGEFSGQKITYDDQDYLVMREPDVIGVING